MIRINLLPGKKESRVASSGSSASGSAGNRWVAFAVAFLILEALGVFFWHLSLKSKLDGIMANNTKTQADIDVIRQKISKHDEVKAKLKDLRDREDAIAKLQAARTGPTATLIELSRVLTTGKGPTTDPDKLERLKRENPAAVPNINWDTRRLWLIDYKELDRAVKITGQARDGEDVSEFLRRVSLSDFFYDIKLQPATKAIDPATKLELVKFELSAKVKY